MPKTRGSGARKTTRVVMGDTVIKKSYDERSLFLDMDRVMELLEEKFSSMGVDAQISFQGNMLDIKVGSVSIALYENGAIEAYSNLSDEKLMDKCLRVIEEVIEDAATEFGELEE